MRLSPCVPTYLSGVDLDCAILEEENPVLEYHCRACGAFGNYWTEQKVCGTIGLLCPACGEPKGEKL